MLRLLRDPVLRSSVAVSFFHKYPSQRCFMRALFCSIFILRLTFLSRRHQKSRTAP